MSSQQMKRKLRNLKRLEYNPADDEDDSKPERVEDVESTLVARLKKMEDNFDELSAMTNKVISFVLNRICVDKNI